MQYDKRASTKFEKYNRNTGEDENMTEEEFLINMKNFFENIDTLKIDLEKQISEIELARNDLLHELELGNLNAPEIMKVAKTLKEVLQERRKYKDELAKVIILKGFTDKYNNKMITGDIILVLKNLRTLEKNKETRTYNPRRITNLKCVEDSK
ncbi:MAG: hypothetical protein IJV31_10475 [Clostridia bacterium]|nr:hypothetical protein [Clostridia bacterium]